MSSATSSSSQALGRFHDLMVAYRDTTDVSTAQSVLRTIAEVSLTQHPALFRDLYLTHVISDRHSIVNTTLRSKIAISPLIVDVTRLLLRIVNAFTGGSGSGSGSSSGSSTGANSATAAELLPFLPRLDAYASQIASMKPSSSTQRQDALKLL